MRIVGTFESRAEWLAARRKGLGASDIAAIAGVSRWSTPWQVYVDKVGAIPLDDNDGATEAMRWGQLLEGLVLDEWERTSGMVAGMRGLMVQHDTHDWALASLDALAFESSASSVEDAVAVVEAKTSSDFAWDEIPIDYQAQAQWQMAITGLDAVIFAVLHNGRALRVYDLGADYDDQAALLEAGERFWRTHVEAQVPPELEAADNAVMADVWPQDNDEAVEVDPDLVDRLVRVRANETQIRRQREELEARIKDQLKDAAVGLVEGRRAVSWRTQAAHRIDTKRLKAEMPGVAEKYTQVTESRVFRLHMKEE